jgi:serine/threonine-protein kinase RsbW
VRSGAADAHTVARLREEFAEWLYVQFQLDDVRSSDIVLVVNEALANAAEFAYRNRDAKDPIRLQAVHREATGALTVTVADRGEWRPSEPANQKLSRGRGIPLMKALSDRVDITTSPHGTEVRLEFDHCARRSDDRAQLSA